MFEVRFISFFKSFSWGNKIEFSKDNVPTLTQYAGKYCIDSQYITKESI